MLCTTNRFIPRLNVKQKKKKTVSSLTIRATATFEFRSGAEYAISSTTPSAHHRRACSEPAWYPSSWCRCVARVTVLRTAFSVFQLSAFSTRPVAAVRAARACRLPRYGAFAVNTRSIRFPHPPAPSSRSAAVASLFSLAALQCRIDIMRKMSSCPVAVNLQGARCDVRIINFFPQCERVYS